MTGPARARLWLCLAAVYLIWGSSYLATRIGVTHLPPLLFGGLRFICAGLVLVGLALLRGLRPSALVREWRAMAVLGVIGVTCVNGLQVLAMQWLPSHTGALLNASCAFWIVGLGVFGRRGHRPEPTAMAGVLIGFVGTSVLIWPGASRLGDSHLVAQLAILLACVFWAIATIYLRNLDTRLGVLALTGAPMAVGGLVLTALGLASGEASSWSWSGPGLLAMGWLTLFSGCLAYTAYTWLAQHASPAVVGTYGYVNPAIATVLGWAVLDETLGVRQLLGTCIILTGVILVNWPLLGTEKPRV